MLASRLSLVVGLLATGLALPSTECGTSDRGDAPAADQVDLLQRDTSLKSRQGWWREEEGGGGGSGWPGKPRKPGDGEGGKRPGRKPGYGGKKPGEGEGEG